MLVEMTVMSITCKYLQDVSTDTDILLISSAQ